MRQGCATWRGDLGAYVIGALDSDERARIRRHLAACPACRTEYEDLLPVRDWLMRTERHLLACPACRTDYEDFLHVRLAHNRGACPGAAHRKGP